MPPPTEQPVPDPLREADKRRDENRRINLLGLLRERESLLAERDALQAERDAANEAAVTALRRNAEMLVERAVLVGIINRYRDGWRPQVLGHIEGRTEGKLFWWNGEVYEPMTPAEAEFFTPEGN